MDEELKEYIVETIFFKGGTYRDDFITKNEESAILEMMKFFGKRPYRKKNEPPILNILDNKSLTPLQKYIVSFNGSYFFLSNFFPSKIKYDGITYYTAEAAFQAAKTFDREIKNKISSVMAYQAKRIGKKVKLRDDWEDVKLNIMEEILNLKFNILELKEKLISTDNSILIEGNNWGDKFWGVYNGDGENNLGKILMKIRSDFSNNT